MGLMEWSDSLTKILPKKQDYSPVVFEITLFTYKLESQNINYKYKIKCAGKILQKKPTHILLNIFGMFLLFPLKVCGEDVGGEDVGRVKQKRNVKQL